jgi:hypothetical protein
MPGVGKSCPDIRTGFASRATGGARGRTLVCDGRVDAGKKGPSATP